jgi:hypothetical protein
MGSNPRLTGGGLIRSLGGWSEVVAARRRETKADQRILGMGDFVNAVLKEAEERHQRPLRAQHSGKKVAHLVHEECLKHGISTEEFRGGSRRTRISQARAIIATRSVRELGASAAEIACVGRDQHLVGEPGDNEDGRRGRRTVMPTRNQRPQGFTPYV